MSSKGARKAAKKTGCCRNTHSAKAGLTFPVGRIRRFLKKGGYAKSVGNGAPIYMAAIMESNKNFIKKIADSKARGEETFCIGPALWSLIESLCNINGKRSPNLEFDVFRDRFWISKDVFSVLIASRKVFRARFLKNESQSVISLCNFSSPKPRFSLGTSWQKSSNSPATPPRSRRRTASTPATSSSLSSKTMSSINYWVVLPSWQVACSRAFTQRSPRRPRDPLLKISNHFLMSKLSNLFWRPNYTTNCKICQQVPVLEITKS